jgi:hypothetical protein
MGVRQNCSTGGIRAVPGAKRNFVPHSKTLRARKRPNGRQVLECVRASATLVRRQGRPSHEKNFVSHPTDFYVVDCRLTGMGART